MFKRGVAETHEALADLQRNRDAETERVAQQDATIQHLQNMVCFVVFCLLFSLLDHSFCFECLNEYSCGILLVCFSKSYSAVLL